MTYRPLLFLGIATAFTLAAFAQPPTVASVASDTQAELRKLGEAYVKAFNAGDAKAAAAFWAENGEYNGPDGEIITGRAEIEKDFAEQFKTNPKATIEMKPESQRAIGNRVVVGEGTCILKQEGKAPVTTEYSALFVREDDGWRVASVREWYADSTTKTKVSDLDWLVGEWSAAGDGKQVALKFTWDKSKTFLHSTYSMTKDGKTVASGMQIIGANPDGGLRSWLFDESGATGQSLWTKDDSRWIVEASGLLPDGTDTSAVNILVPMGKDRFTWQSTARTIGDVNLTDTPPIKVTRVK